MSKPSTPPPKRPEPPPTPALRFSPTAWARLLFFRDLGDTEVGGFAVTAKDDLLLVQDFTAVQQKVSMASVAFDDGAVADFFDRQVDLGRRPEQFARIWLHTHPGTSPTPSAVDEETFERVFGRCDWAVMFVLARGGKTYARLRFNVGPGGEVVVPVRVDYACEFGPSDHEAWEAEYRANVRAETWTGTSGLESQRSLTAAESGCLADDWLDAFGEMHPDDRRLVIDELAARPDLWDESEVTPW